MMKEKKGLLVVSFGTSFADTRKKTVEAIETDLRDTFSDRAFYNAWTSGIIRKKVKETENLNIYSVRDALDRMLSDGIEDVLVQPTFVLEGEEYDGMMKTIQDFSASFKKVAVGSPLLASEEDIRIFAQIIEKEMYGYEQSDLLAMMGHGSGKMRIPVYRMLQEQLVQDGFPGICIGTVEFEPGIEPVLQCVKTRQPKKVALTPLLIVAGDHANNDMAGDEPDSWKNLIRNEGTEAVCLVKGLGENASVREIFVAHAKQAEGLN